MTVICKLGMSQSGVSRLECTDLGQEKKEEISWFFGLRYHLPGHIYISTATQLEGCFWKLEFATKPNGNGVADKFWLTPDQRFITRELIDTEVDVQQQERNTAREMANDLSQGSFASLGRADSEVKIVEFFDFECVYCRQQARVLEDEIVSQPGGPSFRLELRHLPLSVHPWARRAAEATSCIFVQNQQSFWRAYRFLFNGQNDMTIEQIDDELERYLKSEAGFDIARYKKCLEDGNSVGSVQADVVFAASHNIISTPTLFINGYRYDGYLTRKQLTAAIKDVLSRTSLESPSAEK